MRVFSPLLVTGCVVVLYFATVSSLAVMSVDLGSEWMKIGYVSPGVPMEIALNKESKRKTPAVITFRDGLRSFGEDAQALGIRFPKNSYSYLLDLLGKDFNNPIVQLYKKRFPYYELLEDPDRGTVLFKVSENTTYSVEELVSQLLYKAKDYAEIAAGQQIKECVLTVPGYFNQIEREAMLQAAKLADLKVLQLINDYTAVALNYGIFRRKDFNESAYYILFYDMGASKTVATIVSYQLVKTKDRGFVETNPQSTIIGVGYDRSLGGLELQLRLRDFLADKFNSMKLTKNDVKLNPRAMAKLFKEAGRVKNVLSANADHYAQIENLLDDKDFRVQITRDDFEELCADVFNRVGDPVKKALNMAGLSMDVLNQVVLVGAGTRVPKVQAELQKIVKMELSKNLNTDEAATMGAVYKAADLSKGFKVQKFITKDGVLFPIQVVFERVMESGDVKQVRRTLFGIMNPYPQKKIITFNKHSDDFKFYVNYADLDHLSPEDLITLGTLNITEISLKGVGAAIKKNQGESVDFKGIKAHFQLDDSGLFQLINVDLAIEKVLELEDEGAFAKLGSTISNLFKSGEDKPVVELPPEQKDEPNATELPPKPDEPTEEGSEPSTSAPKNETQTNTTDAKPTKDTKEKKPKSVILKENIDAVQKPIGLPVLSDKQIEESRKKIELLNVVDRERLARETALNNLESFVIDTQNKIFQDDFMAASTDEEVTKIQETCSQISDWLYEDGENADLETYNKKLEEVKTLTHPLYSRVYEHKERPEALAALKQMLNGSEAFLASAKNLTGKSDNEVFTQVEVNNLEKVILETREWRDKMVIDQDALKKSEPVALTVRALSEKMSILDREVKYLVNKLKIWRPKTPPPKPVKEEVDEESVLKNILDDIKVHEVNQEEAPETADKDGEPKATPEKEQVKEETEEKDDSDNHKEL